MGFAQLILYNVQWYAVEVDKMTRIDGNSEDDFSLSEVEVEEEEEEESNKGKSMEHRFRSARSLHVEVLFLFLENQTWATLLSQFYPKKSIRAILDTFQHNDHPPLLDVKVLQEIDEDIDYFPEKRTGVRTT